ncbi:type VII secretion protein EccE [Amycolatopsis acidicola]|uniref:Type VII secretion protein EccE n=2 Tax=Amycolatopsis acidicola TaxID=2596893 RepID=A0A5N0VKM1_9PSEU|nr:type VII secretion protein EccE [Amycolatopsis acidicola]
MMSGQLPQAATQFKAPEAPRGRPRGAAWFRPRRNPGRLGVLSLARLLVFEIVLVVVFFVLFQEIWSMILGGVLGLVALVLVFGRAGGRWWTESFLLWLGFRARDGSAGESRDDPRLTALSELAPDLVVENVAGPGDSELGMGSDGAGWFAVLEVAVSGPLPPVPLSALSAIAAEAEQAGVVIQVVSHRDPRGNVLWVAVRLDARQVAESMIDRPGDDVDVPVVLAEVTRRAERALRRRGLQATVLDADGVVEALSRSCDLVPGARIRENWQAWHSARLAHGCFWVEAWPDSERGTSLLAAFLEVPAALVSVALLLEPADEGTSLRCLVRTAIRPDRYKQLSELVTQIAVRAGARLSRLDGQHAPAVYASAPSGGGAR